MTGKLMSPKYIQDMSGMWLEVSDFRGDLSISDSVQECVSAKMSKLYKENSGLTQKQMLGKAYGMCRAAQDFMRYSPKMILDMITDDAMDLPRPAAPGVVGGPNVRPMRTIAEAVKVAGDPAGVGKKSSNIDKIGYFNSMLEVEFKGGRRYVYFVGPEFYEKFVKSESKGKWLWENLRGKRPGLVFDDPSKKTPGGVPFSGGKGSIVPYSKGSGGTPEPGTLRPQEPTVPAGKKAELLRKELEIQFRGAGLKYPKISEGLPSTDFAMGGFITRSGEFDYGPNNVKIKEWDNLKELFNETAHFPMFGTKSYGSHGESYDSLIGFTHNWEFFEPGVIDKDGHIYAKQEFFANNITDLSDLKDPNNLPVSIGFIDLGEGKIQEISKLRHLAVSLNKLEGDRCSTEGGLGCNISIIKSEGRDTNDLHTNNYLKLNNGEKIMGDNKDEYDEETTEILEDMYNVSKGDGSEHELNPEAKFKLDCKNTNHSEDACDKAWDAVKQGGEQAVKKKSQTPGKYSGDSIEIGIKEYADLMATAKVWKETKDFIDKLKKAEETRVQKEAEEVIDYLINIKHVEEDFVKEYGKNLCDLKLMKATIEKLPKSEEDLDADVQEINTGRLMNQLGDKIEDFKKMEEEYREEALTRFFPN